MTRTELEKTLKTYGEFLRVYADSDHIVYVPESIAEKLRTREEFKEIREDTLYNSLRHQNQGKALIAFQY